MTRRRVKVDIYFHLLWRAVVSMAVDASDGWKKIVRAAGGSHETAAEDLLLQFQEEFLAATLQAPHVFLLLHAFSTAAPANGLKMLHEMLSDHQLFLDSQMPRSKPINYEGGYHLFCKWYSNLVQNAAFDQTVNCAFAVFVSNALKQLDVVWFAGEAEWLIEAVDVVYGKVLSTNDTCELRIVDACWLRITARSDDSLQRRRRFHLDFAAQRQGLPVSMLYGYLPFTIVKPLERTIKPIDESFIDELHPLPCNKVTYVAEHIYDVRGYEGMAVNLFSRIHDAMPLHKLAMAFAREKDEARRVHLLADFGKVTKKQMSANSVFVRENFERYCVCLLVQRTLQKMSSSI